MESYTVSAGGTTGANAECFVESVLVESFKIAIAINILKYIYNQQERSTVSLQPGPGIAIL